MPGSDAFEDHADATLERVSVLAPPGALERLHVLAHALRVLKPGGVLDVMAPKARGGARLAKELAGFGVGGESEARAHHRRMIAVRPAEVQGLAGTIARTGPQRVPVLGLISQPGVFSWDRIDPGSLMLARHLAGPGGQDALAGRGADLGCGIGHLAIEALRSPQIAALRLIDIDRRAIACARANIKDARALIEWADVRALPEADLDFVISNPPFHAAGEQSHGLGQMFLEKAALMLRRGGRALIVANRHLPYERTLSAHFSRVSTLEEGAGYKVIEAVK
ncbi:MAG: class I SAM-dependent methyltransferase [Brevundimonas sp.]|uniref:class I SAM-dependent methyltransferase n=1 Tax=Brevundimonas sp. TaxID=1871086 RepID=UPI00391B3DBC